MPQGQQSIQQYFDCHFSNDANTIYNTIVNCVPIKPPYYNESIRYTFTQGYTDKGDKEIFFLQKRKGFKRVDLYTDTGQKETAQERVEGYVTDVKVVDGERYFLVLNNTKTKLRIYKQVYSPDFTPCDNSNISSVTDGMIVNITSYNGRSYFPFQPCLYDKFLLTTHVKGKPIKKSTTGIAIMKRVADTYFSYLSDATLTDTVPSNAGYYVYTHGDHILSGFVHVLTGNTTDVEGRYAVAIQGTRAPAMAMVSDINIIENVNYKIFPKYGLTLHFVTSDGIVNWHYDEGTAASAEYTIVGDTYKDTLDNSMEPRFNISSLITYNQTTVRIDRKTGIMAIGDQGYNKFYYSPQRFVHTYGLYTQLAEFMGHILLLGPENIAYFMYEHSTGIGKLVKVVEDNGYFSKDSWCVVDTKLFIVRKTQDLYILELQFGYGSSTPVPIFTYMNKFLNSELKMLDRKTDMVNLTVNDNNIFIFINGAGDKSKILIFDRFYSFWYKRLVSGYTITNVYNGIYYGNGIFVNEGETDGDNPITQVISLVFGDLTQHSTKYLDWIKMVIGYNSYITKHNSFLTVGVYNGGWYNEINYNDLTNSDYVTNLMRLRLDPENDNQTLQAIKNYPIEIEIYGGIGINRFRKPCTLLGEFQRYEELNAQLVTVEEENNKFTVAKMGVLKADIGRWGEVFTITLVARGTNKIEFGGFLTAFRYDDTDSVRIENNLTYAGLTIDSGMTFDPPRLAGVQADVG